MKGLPGDLLLRLAARLFSARTMERVIGPAVADLQHEVTGAGTTWRRALARARGYLACARAVALTCATWPARAWRDDWSTSTARGPRLLSALAPRALLIGGLFLLAMMGALARHIPDASILVWGLPCGLTAVAPLAFLLGVTLAGGRLIRARTALRSWLGAAAALSVVPAVGLFVLVAWITPPANQVYRERFLRRFLVEKARTGADGIVGPVPDRVHLDKGTRELTLGELHDRAAAARAKGEDTLVWDVEWHKKWALAAGCLALGPLALGLLGLFRRWRTASAVVAGSMVAWLHLAAWGVAERAALGQALPAWAALWAGDALLALLALALVAALPPDEAGIISGHAHRDALP